MRTEPRVLAERLKRVEVLSVLDDKTLLELASKATQKSYDRGQTIWRVDDSNRETLVVLSGRLDVLRETETGHTMIFRSVGPDHIAGLSVALGAKHTADVVAGEDSRVLVLSASQIEPLVANAAFAKEALLYMSRVVNALSDGIEDLRAFELRERIVRHLRRNYQHVREVRVTDEELGEMVNATRPNVSRAIQSLAAEGIVARGEAKGFLKLVNLDKTPSA
jgi:CRP/FNR family transcriptional regulator, cyclic AMP receptor protein